MKINTYKIGVVGLAILLASCSTTQYSYRKSTIPQKHIITGQAVVDSKLDLSKRIEGTSSARNSVEEAKQEAYYKAITQNNIDVIVDPIYEVRTTDRILFFGGKSTAKVTGIGAVYTNPRTKVEAINELTKVDTANIRKFDAIYLNKNSSKRVLPTNTAPTTTTDSKSQNKTTLRSGWGVALNRIATGLSYDSNLGTTASNYALGVFKDSFGNGKFGFNYGLFYSNEGNENQKLSYARVPIKVQYNIWKKLTIQAGVQVGYVLSSDGFKGGPYGFSEPESFDYGLMYGLGYRIGSSFSINYSLYSGMSNVTTIAGNTFKNYNAGLGLAYHF
ncbi:MAG: hypothetical protein CFE24_01240 [Flavobacterium sp. BFFFF2]|nr:MAG: hypothetical protein CFE24_01240 [Flavobacterium sp. BFFFF2]